MCRLNQKLRRRVRRYLDLIMFCMDKNCPTEKKEKFKKEAGALADLLCKDGFGADVDVDLRNRAHLFEHAEKILSAEEVRKICTRQKCWKNGSWIRVAARYSSE